MICFRGTAALQSAALFLHEAFHASTFVEEEQRVGGYSVSDRELAEAVGRANAEDPSKAFSDEINKHYGPTSKEDAGIDLDWHSVYKKQASRV